MTSFHRPTSVEEVTSLLASLDEPMIYGGGTAIQILRKQGILFAEEFIDISGIERFRDVVIDDDSVTVGPMVTVRRMETDPRIRAAIPLVTQAYAHVANPRVRNTASVGGNIAHGDYRLDPPTALLVMDAMVSLTSERGTREVPIREFFVDFQVTDVGPDEFITGITIPRQSAAARGRFVKFSSLSANDWPCASVSALAAESDGVTEMRLGLGALAPTSLYLAFDLEPHMSDQDVVDAAVDIANSAMDPIPDIRGSASYKSRIGRVIVEQAVREVVKELEDA